MKLLITGGAGFIGSSLCEKYVKEGHTVICMDNFLSGSLTNIKHLLDFQNFKQFHQKYLNYYINDFKLFGYDCLTF